MCFFQAEDGIRDIGVTGVQTCALPIFACGEHDRATPPERPRCATRFHASAPAASHDLARRTRRASARARRSEERRVGNEWSSRWKPGHEKKMLRVLLGLPRDVQYIRIQ